MAYRSPCWGMTNHTHCAQGGPLICCGCVQCPADVGLTTHQECTMCIIFCRRCICSHVIVIVVSCHASIKAVSQKGRIAGTLMAVWLCLKMRNSVLLQMVSKLPGGGGGIPRGEFSAGKFRISTWCGIFPSFFEEWCGIFPMRNCACVSHRRTCLGLFLGMVTLNKGANVCWCLITSKAQACGYALQILWY